MEEDTEASLVSPHFFAGLALCLLNCTLSSAGFVMQRYAHLLSVKDGESGKGGMLPTHRLLRVVGIILYILAAVPDVLAYTLVPQVVCTTVACFRLVVMTFLAHFVLQEHVAGREILGMSACSMGTFLCLVFGPRTDQEALQASAGEFYHPQVWTYLLVGLCVLIALLVAEHMEDRFWCPLPKESHWVTLPLATGLAFALEKVFNTEVGFISPPEDLEGLAEEPIYGVMWLCVALLGLLDFHLNVRGAQRLPIQVFVPITFALATSLQFFQSIVIFREFENMDTKHAALSILGAVVSLAGAVMIRPPRLGAAENEDETSLLETTPRDDSCLDVAPEASSDEGL